MSMPVEHCDKCGEPLEAGQIGKCEGCQDGARVDAKPLFYLPIVAVSEHGRIEDECVIHDVLSMEQREYTRAALNAHAALLELRAKYNRLHDLLDDCMTGKRLTETELPDDFAALADALAECVAADAAVAEILEGK